MKTLSIRQPWASLILLGIKRIENRSWPAPSALIGQRLAIHAARKPDSLHALPDPATLPRGVLLGTVRLVACVRHDELPPELASDPFAEAGGWCWILAEPR